MKTETAKVLTDVMSQMEVLATQLESDVRPGHVNYISKKDASVWVYRLLLQLGEVK